MATRNMHFKGLTIPGRKASSQEPSPLHSSKPKKETSAFIRLVDLDAQLKVMSSSRNSAKKEESKFPTKNLQIIHSNLASSFAQPNSKKNSPAAPVSASIPNRKNSKQYLNLFQKEELGVADYRNSKNSKPKEKYNNSFEEVLYQKLVNGSLNAKNPSMTLTSKNNMAGRESADSAFLAKFKLVDNNPKALLKTPIKPANQLELPAGIRKQQSRAQKRSFDINVAADPMTKYSPYLGMSYSKPSSTINNSPRNKEPQKPKPEDLQQEYPARIISGVGPKTLKPVIERPKQPLSAKLNFESPLVITKHHRKTPSLEIHKNTDRPQKAVTPTILDRVRKSVDNVEGWQHNNLASEVNKKHRFRVGVRTRAGVSPNGTRKINQDSFIFISNFGDKSDRYLFGVCDGHGMNGHLVSSFVKEALPTYLLADPNFSGDTGTAFTNSFELCQQKLQVIDFDCKFSGTTTVVVLVDGNKIMTANAGDSRAVIAGFNRTWECRPLSFDHKPNNPGEALRIQKAGGRIDSFKDFDGNPVGPSRVWLRDQDIPGLAMSRSLGDFVAQSVGVSCLPEIKEFTIAPTDKFMIIASDGVWEFLENIDVVKLIVPYYEQNNLDGACNQLLGLALHKWQEEEEVVVDDITLIIVFL